MDAQILNNRIYVKTRHPSHHVFGGLPGYRFDKKLQTHTFPLSPMSAARIKHIHKTKWPDESFTWTPGFGKLLDQWKRIQSRQDWKNPKLPSKPLHKWLTKTKPWDHQTRAFEFAYGLPSIYLAMEMGTGKTLVAIQEILCYEPNMTLILCPKSVIEVWAEQFQTHAPDAGYMIVPLTETTSAKKADRLEFVRMLTLTSKKPLVIVVNYESAIRGELKKQLLGIKWDHLILDEAHKIKAAGGKASRFCTKLQLNEFGRKRLLSGTMLPNNKLDAYGQFRFLEPGMYGTNFTKFRNLFAEMGGYQGYQIVGWKNEERFNKILNSITFHVDKSVLDLPPTLTLYRPVEISPTGRDLLRNIEKEFIADVGAGTVTAANALSRLVKMREVTSGFVRDDDEVDHHVHDGRLDALEEVLEEIGPDKKVVVFCEFRWDLDQVMSAANRLGRKYGEVSGRFNDTVEARYPPDVQILGIHPKSGGLGLNLQDSHYCIFYSVGFSLGDYEQALSRVERGGQTESVRAIHLVAKGTVDEQVYAALRDKKKVVLEIMDYVKRGGKF